MYTKLYSMQNQVVNVYIGLYNAEISLKLSLFLSIAIQLVVNFIPEFGKASECYFAMIFTSLGTQHYTEYKTNW